MSRKKHLVDSHECGVLIDQYDDGTATVSAWCDQLTESVSVKDAKSALDAAEQMLRAWADGFKEGTI